MVASVAREDPAQVVLAAECVQKHEQISPDPARLHSHAFLHGAAVDQLQQVAVRHSQEIIRGNGCGCNEIHDFPLVNCGDGVCTSAAQMPSTILHHTSAAAVNTLADTVPVAA